MTNHYLAFDLGADSGRLMLGTLADGRITLEELHRFANGPVKNAGTLHWNLEGLFTELKAGLKKAAARKLPIASISSDSWGVDYVLYDERGLPMSPVWHYRDARTALGVSNVNAKLSWPEIYDETGIQFMALNTLYQIAAEPAERLAKAKQFLLIGDAINHYCSGVARNEVSLASTSQMYNPRTRTWSAKILGKLGLAPELFAPLCHSGTRLGPLKKSLCAETGMDPIEVVATCSHDTGAAVAAVPAADQGNWAYLSSGTWSLMGVEWPQPVITEQSRSMSFTNEIGYANSVRLLKNIIGLWIVQECRRQFTREGYDHSYTELTQMAERAPGFGAVIDPDKAPFLTPGDMPGKIERFCKETRQKTPSTRGEYVRTCLDSLALTYRRTLEGLEDILGRKIKTIHIVGGGSQNLLLNQMTADACGRTVVAGPIEGTAIGNILVQAMATGQVKSLAEARAIVRSSFNVKTYEPQDTAKWDAAYARYREITAK